MSRDCSLINGSVLNLYTGRDVPFSRQNDVGFSERKNTLFNTESVLCRLLSTPSLVLTTAGRTNVASLVDSGSFHGVLSSVKLTSGDVVNSFIRQGIQSPVVSGLIDYRAVSIKKKPGWFCYINQGNGFATNQNTLINLQDGSVVSSTINTVITDLGDAIRVNTGMVASSTTAAGIVYLTFYPSDVIGSYSHAAGEEFWISGFDVRGVLFTDYQRIISDPGTNVRIPALLSDPTTSAAADPLTYTGKAHFDGVLEQSNCLTFDGVDDYIAMDLADIAVPELVTNGTFDTDITGWIATGSGSIIDWDAGRLSVTRTVGATDRATLEIDTEEGESYIVSYDQVESPVATSVRIGTGLNSLSGINTLTSPNGGSLTFKFIFRAVTSSTFLSFGPNSNTTALFDNVSVRKLPKASTPKYSPNIFSNPGFDTDSEWLKTDVTIVDGKAVWDNVIGSVRQEGIGKIGLCLITVTISDYVSGDLYFRDGNYNYQFPDSNGTHSILVRTTSPGTSFHTFAPSTFKIDEVSLQFVSEVDHDGTSLLTYRPEGDGINGTAGTAFNIQLGDVEHIPCCEGHGDKVHGTKLNQAYQIVNGQFSNWETKQDVYHYSIVKGASKVGISDETDEQKVEELFAESEEGAVYDWSDLSTLFQDAGGTIPVTASGQTVGLHLDKSKGLVLGSELRQTGVIGIVGSATPATFNTSSGVGQCTRVDISNQSFIQFSGLVPDGFYKLTLSNTGSGSVAIRTGGQAGTTLATILSGTTADAYVYANINGQITLTSATAGTVNFTLDTIKRLPGNHRYQVSAASRPQYMQDGNLHYGLYDGVDDFMETNNVDFTGTDKMTVWWGGRKLSALGKASAVYGLTNNPLPLPNSFELQAPGSTAEYQISSAGTTRRTATTASFPAPDTAVLTQISNIAAPLIVLRRNGTSIATDTLSQGTGNYANAKLFFGSRGGTTVRFDGREYMTIIRGAETDTFTIQEIENVVARKVGLDEFHYEGNLYIPASQTNPGFDALGNPLTHLARVGLNAWETEINFSPVADSWPVKYSIPGADLPNYTFDGDPGDIEIRVDTATVEGKFRLRK